MAEKDNIENILVFCAHSDDQIFGPGGALAKYAREGKKIYTYIFTYGELTHPHFKRKVIVKIRVKESQKADEEIKGCGVSFFGLTETKFFEETKEKGFHDKIRQIILEKNPTKIFTHNADDPHADHRAVNQIVLDAIEEVKSSADVYAFDVWSPLSLAYRKNPKLVVDISKTFRIKIKALGHFESQKLAMVLLLWSVYAKAIKNGLLNGYRYAEVFYKIR